MKRAGRLWLWLWGALWIGVGVLPAQVRQIGTPLLVGAPGTPPPVEHADPQIAAALRGIAPDRIEADIAKLVSFGRRQTLSSMRTDLPPGEGILPAADWITAEFKRISAGCGGCLEVKRDDFVEPGSDAPHARIPNPTRLVNVYAILHGTSPDKAAPWVLVTGHYDSRVNDILDATSVAPGANDDASGVAVSLESARALSHLRLPGTMVFVAVAGEEQGLNGSRHLAKLAKAEGWPLEAVLNNDIVGGDTTPGETQQKKDVVRIFSEGIPASDTPQQQKEALMLGAENDSPSRELAREIAALTPAYFPGDFHRPAGRNGLHGMAVMHTEGFHPVLIHRLDRYLRGGDHASFNAEGFAAVRFTEWRENFNHQHQDVRTVDGVEFGDELKFVDPAYVANVARMNAMTLATLAEAPSEPRAVQVVVGGLDNNTELRWQPSAFAPPGTTYEVVWRDTTADSWQHALNVGAVTGSTLNVSKDNVLFGVRAVASNGQRSLPVPPLPTR